MTKRLVVIFVAFTMALLVDLAVWQEVKVRMTAAEFRALDQAAVMASEAIYAYDVLAYDPRDQRAILPSDELAARAQRVSLEGERIMRRANDLEHETAYPCTIRTFYRECFR